MVKSGLTQKPDYQTRQRVSTYRLATHLSLALSIYSLLIWNALTLLRQSQESYLNPKNFKEVMRFRNKVIFVLPFVALNLFSGVAVAGIDAGKVKLILMGNILSV